MADDKHKELDATTREDEKRTSSIADDGLKTEPSEFEKHDDRTAGKEIDVEARISEDPEKAEAVNAAKHDPNIVDYDGPDDPENPYNWSTKKKWTNGGLLSALTFVT
jgi:hypothetical protein